MRQFVLLTILLIVAFCSTSHAQQAPTLDLSGADWIWHHKNVQIAYFRRMIQLGSPAKRIFVLISADNFYELWVNGQSVGSSADWKSPQKYEISQLPACDRCIVAIRAASPESPAGLICKLVITLRDGNSVIISSDAEWLSTDKPEPDWNNPEIYSEKGWAHVQVLGEYPCEPWGRISEESWEDLSAKLAQRQTVVVGTPSILQYSQFRGEYVRPEYASLYESFVKLNPKNGLLEHNGKVIRPFFTIYSQPKPGGGQILNIPDFDFDLLEDDFARMKQAGINVQPRFWSWAELLDYDNSWKRLEKQPKGHGLPHFTYVYQVYDYFLDRAQAHGLYANIELSYYWGLHPEVIPPAYRGKILLYGELWNAAGEAYAKILRYYSRRTCIVAVMVGEEDLVFDHCFDEPTMLREFQRFIRRRYGSVSNLQRVWRHGYDTANQSLWRKQTVSGKNVIWPDYPFTSGVFDLWTSFDDVKLPIFDHYRLADVPNFPLNDLPTYQENLARDPMWIDFMDMKEQMLISRLNDLVAKLRAADANHILYYCNPYDFNPAWHMLHCFDRGRLRWDVIGVGQHDSGFDPAEVPRWASCREYVQNVASYGPYLDAVGAYPKGFACGEGMGGKTREGTAKYYPWWLADIVGGGGAFFQSYDWNHIAGRSAEKPRTYDETTLRALESFLYSVRDVPFTRNSNAEVLILRSKNAAYGMSAGFDFGNVRSLAEMLYQIHVPFDILPDTDVSAGSFELGKINLNKYRFIFVPAQNQLLPPRAWQMLEDWITDPRYAGRRGLCFGLYQDLDCYFNPVKPPEVHRAFERLTGTKGFTRRVPVSGKMELRFTKFFGSAARGDSMTIFFPESSEIGCMDDVPVEKILEMEWDSSAVVIRNVLNGNPVYLCGFYLGMAYNATWGLEKEQSPYNAFTPLYRAMLESSGVKPSVDAPDNLGVYVAEGSVAVLVKERFGKPIDLDIGLSNLHGAVLNGATTVHKSNGSTRLSGCRIEPYGTLVFRRIGAVVVRGGTDISTTCRPYGEENIRCEICGYGEVEVDFQLQPEAIYSVLENGELSKVFTTDHRGIHTMTFDLHDGSKPLPLEIKHSGRR